MTKLLSAVLVAGALACGSPGPNTDPALQASVAPTAAATPVVPAKPGVLREEAVVPVVSVPERWALVWRRPPVPACAALDGGAAPDALSCPCEGFAYGERGELDLVRRRPGAEDERLALTPLFRDSEGLGYDEAMLQRWPALDSDYAAADPVDLGPAIRARPVTHAMVLGDYDHDGRATEFLLQVGAAPCGHRDAVVVGVSRADSALHAFTSAAHPERPLVLDPDTWARLLRSDGRVTVVEWRCADHGSETQTEVSLRAGPAGIDGVRSEYACPDSGGRGRLLRSERI